ncbi:cytochrome P450 [Dactylonectria macrodidyma]|uniref:Cytochrome P450 n=1 Tax=Dactylonectria macrodidyma TaxID=307937 RepID=A0A9P9FSU9_9HYPO|nr:cytochrome P450 [Dactylonectria macrodidyma]
MYDDVVSSHPTGEEAALGLATYWTSCAVYGMRPLLLTPFSREYLLVTVVILLLALPLQVLEGYFRRWKHSQAIGCREPTRKSVKDPIIGLDFLFDALFGEAPKSYLDSTWKAFQAMGTTYTEKRLTWETVYTCDSQNLKYMLATGADDFDLPHVRTSVIGSTFGQGIFALSGHPWKHARSVLKNNLKTQNLSTFLNAIEQHFQTFLEHVPIDGTNIDLSPLFAGLIMDVATEFLMGHSTHMLTVDGIHNKGQQFLDDYMVCSEEIMQRMQLGPLHPFRINFQANRAKKRVYEYLDTFIEDSLRQPNNNEGVNLLTEIKSMNSDRKSISDQILHILLASRDTTSSLMSNLFFVLAKKPHLYAKLREEVLRATGGAPPTTSQLQEMRYLKWCVKESLRLHPVVPTNIRVALRDTALPRGGGPDGQSPVFVRKGSILIYNVYAMHRIEATFGADPEEFVPERWEDLRPGWGYLPFNGGARSCVGQQHALLETHYIVARMVQTFKTLESRDEDEWTELYALTLCSKNGARVAVTV